MVLDFKNHAKSLAYSIADATGRVALAGKGRSSVFRINVTGLSAGIYVITLHNTQNEISASFTFLKQ